MTVAALRRAEFEARMFVSLAIAAAVGALGYAVLPPSPPNVVRAGGLLGASPAASATAGFLAIAALLAVATLLRMWAGSALTSDRVMSFAARTEALVVRGPYRLVRNPIYLADLLAMAAFAAALPPVGMLLPVLLALHYGQVIRHEEACFAASSSKAYRAYCARVGRLWPGRAGRADWAAAAGEFRLTPDGVRHNALYALFAAGFVVAAFGNGVGLAYAIGAPALIDWAVVHARKGIGRKAPRRGGVFTGVLYAQCWEDPATDRAALRIAPGDSVLCITSGGDNALAFLLDDPARVIALDMNPHQNHLLDLKRRAVERLGHAELLELMGVRRSARRADLYARVRPAITEESRRFWDGRPGDVAAGILHAGRYERFLGLLRTWVRRLVGRAAIAGLYARPDAAARAAWYARRWDTLRFRVLTRVVLSRWFLSRLFDPAMFAHVAPGFRFGAHFEAIVRRALTALPLRENPHLAYVLLGRFVEAWGLPQWLRPENHDLLRSRVDRLELVTGPCGDYVRALAPGAVSKFDFSNVFEWMAPEDHARVLADAARVAGPGGVIVYRNLIVPRERPASLAHRLEPDLPLARSLLDGDLSFLYSNYVVERVREGA